LLPALGCAALLTAQTAERQQGRLPFEQDKLMKDQAAARTPVMIYHGGPVMSASTTTYIVYYGSFTSTQHDILDTFLENLGGSPAFNVNTEYYDSGNNFVQNVLNYNPATNSYDDAYSKGTTLRGAFVTEILHNAVAGGHLPSDVNGIYVLTISPDVKIPANSWCAYHSHASTIIAGEDIKYALAADPPAGSILSSCSGNIAIYGDTTSPNGDIGMDEVVDSLIHEFSETVTDPDINAWYTRTGEEVGDVCNFTYGTTFLAPNGSHANHTFGTRNYLAQEIWSMENPVACVQGH
jgi:hypothetical protein